MNYFTYETFGNVWEITQDWVIGLYNNEEQGDEEDQTEFDDE